MIWIQARSLQLRKLRPKHRADKEHGLNKNQVPTPCSSRSVLQDPLASEPRACKATFIKKAHFSKVLSQLIKSLKFMGPKQLSSVE